MQTVSYQSSQAQVRVNEFVRSVYNWMAIGLAITGFIAYYTATNLPLIKFIYSNSIIFYGLIIGELVLVYAISSRIYRMNPGTATGLFVLYSGLNGLTLAFIFLVYTQSAITSTFFVCAATFGACSVYGWVTKRDLTSMAGFMTMGLIGIIIASIVNMFVKSSAMAMIISYIGVLVFVGLTAYDTQKIKSMAMSQPMGLEAGVIRKGAILGALTLYLDFINLFLMLLRIMGGSSRD